MICLLRRPSSRVRQLDGGQQAFVELGKVAFQQHRHVPVAQPYEGPAKNPPEQYPHEPQAGDPQHEHPDRPGRLEEPVDCQAGPKRNPQPRDRRRQSFEPHVPADPPPQRGQLRPDGRGQL